ncbi:MAG TPA: F0F1 ATP synthase subunit B [Acetobacteraceae bacterium]|jgi:F-type H+-transporting ATPase subunit b|nr:F0F1 ATP synthase subunit B [Acetobacteraceae bacterium]
MRRLTPLLVFTAVGLAAAPAFAEGMPQLAFSNPFTTAQILWGAIIFIVLYGILARFALPQVSSVLELRASTIANDLQAAHMAKEDADAAVAEMTETNRKARAEAQAAIAAAAEAAKRRAEEQAAALNEKLEKQLAEAEARIAAAHAAAMRALRQVVTDTTGALVVRLTGEPANDDQIGAAVDSMMRERSNA